MRDDRLHRTSLAHGSTDPQSPPNLSSGTNAPPSGVSFVPVAEQIGSLESPADFTPNPEGPTGPGSPFPIPEPGSEISYPFLKPWPPWRFCFINLRTGCYRITFRPSVGLTTYRGTMRVDTVNGVTTISGDLYSFFPTLYPFPVTELQRAAIPRIPPYFPLPYDIPIYARNRYYSYLKVTKVQRSPILTTGPCQLTLTAEEYVYTQPPAGSFNGTFPAAPGTRTVTIVLQAQTPPFGYTSSYFEGKLYESGVEKGSFTMGWVSSFFRKATLEIDTLVGAVAPGAVPAISGAGSEYFTTVLATAGWDLNVVVDQTNVAVPAGVNPNVCWTSPDLHALMLAVRNPATDLDKEWRLHLVVVPATMGCGRGVMYDVIQVPREGVASFCDDGYPSTDSANFGTAANQQQRNVPRAFLRSASHEVGHGFNQIHQEQEGGADNSIMTTTPSVADVLGGPTTGEPGVFPDNINLGFNDHVRHHLIHFPDIVVRPGGMTFGTGHSSIVPEADRHYFSAQELELILNASVDQIELGEPLRLTWTLINRSSSTIRVPSDIRIETQSALITVTDARGRTKLMPSFAIYDESSIKALEAGEKVVAETRLFWSSNGFAFPTPGKYLVEVRVQWIDQGVPFGVKSSIDIWVNYPQATADNDTAAALMHPQVGMYVALGGGATHLTEAVSRLDRVGAFGKGDQPRPKALRGYEGLLSIKTVGARTMRETPKDEAAKDRKAKEKKDKRKR